MYSRITPWNVLDDSSELFAAIKEGDDALALQMLQRNPNLLACRNQDGAAPVHAAYLHKQFLLGEQILTRYPESVAMTYGAGPYAGENVLHIAIVHRNGTEVQWLLDRFPTLLNDETYGRFFEPASCAYFGGFPLLFTVATNQPGLLQRVLAARHAAPATGSLQCRDRFGNTAFHIAVIHDLVDMWHFLLRLEAAKMLYGPGDTPLSQQPNNENLTPLTLACAMGRHRLVECMLQDREREAWAYGPVQCVMAPLREIDQPRLVRINGRWTVGNHPVLLRCMSAGQTSTMTNCLRRHGHKIPHEVHEGRLRIAALPVVRDLLDAKWKHFGKRAFLPRFVMAIVVMVLWTAAIIIPNDYSESRKPVADPEATAPASEQAPPQENAAFTRTFAAAQGAARAEGDPPGDWPNYLELYPISSGFIIACEACVLAFVTWTILKELIRLVRVGPRRYFGALRGVVAAMHFLRMTFCLFVIIDVGLRASWQYTPQLVFTSLASLAGWMYVLIHFIAFFSTGPFLTMVHRMVTEDIPKFAIVFAIIIFTFTTAMAPLYEWPPDETPSTPVGYWMIWRGLLWTGTVRRVFSDNLDEGDSVWLFNFLLVMYGVANLVICLSILIAMLENRYHEVSEDAEPLWYQERANLMEFLESEFSVEDMYRLRCQYSTPHPEDVHRDFDNDLYLPVISKMDGWKLAVDADEQLHVETRKRAVILSEEQESFQAIEQLEALERADEERASSCVPISVRYLFKRKRASTFGTMASAAEAEMD